MAVRPWILYTLVRVGLFAVMFAILYALTANLWSFAWAAAAVVAALLSLCISYIFFRPLRERVAMEWVSARERPASGAGADEDVEDAAAESERQRGGQS